MKTYVYRRDEGFFTIKDGVETKLTSRPAIVLFSVVVVMFGVCTVLAFVLFIIFLPVILVIHFVLRLFGRRGFIIPLDNGRFNIEVDRAGFKRQ